MNKEKYFTPEISDIRIGYECESKNKINWVKWVIEDPEFMRTVSLRARYFKAGETEYSYNLEGIIKTPYLTKEAIEAEGWVSKEKDFTYEIFKGYIKGNDWIEIDYDYSSHHLDISIVRNRAGEIYFPIYNGECKDLNTLREIQRLLKI